MPKLIYLFVFMLFLSACDGVGVQNNDPDNKDKAVRFLNGIAKRNAAVLSLVNEEKFVQHNVDLVDGIAGIRSLFENQQLSIEIKRVFQDQDHVVIHSVYDIYGKKVVFDVFRFENGLIVEQWNNIIPQQTNNLAGRSQTDGTSKFSDIEKTEENRALVKDYTEKVLMKRDYTIFEQYFKANELMQHSPTMEDGVSGIGKAMQEMGRNAISKYYNKLHKTLAYGDFVLTICEGKFADRHASYYDLYRVKDGKLAEHWDVVYLIPPPQKWKSSGGKF